MNDFPCFNCKMQSGSKITDMREEEEKAQESQSLQYTQTGKQMTGGSSILLKENQV